MGQAAGANLVPAAFLQSHLVGRLTVEAPLVLTVSGPFQDMEHLQAALSDPPPVATDRTEERDRP